MSNLKKDLNYYEITQFVVKHGLAEAIDKYGLTAGRVRDIQTTCRKEYVKEFCMNNKCTIDDFNYAMCIAMYAPKNETILRVYNSLFNGGKKDYVGLAALIDTSLYGKARVVPQEFKDALISGLYTRRAAEVELIKNIPVPRSTLNEWL